MLRNSKVKQAISLVIISLLALPSAHAQTSARQQMDAYLKDKFPQKSEEPLDYIHTSSKLAIGAALLWNTESYYRTAQNKMNKAHASKSRALEGLDIERDAVLNRIELELKHETKNMTDEAERIRDLEDKLKEVRAQKDFYDLHARDPHAAIFKLNNDLKAQYDDIKRRLVEAQNDLLITEDLRRKAHGNLEWINELDHIDEQKLQHLQRLQQKISEIESKWQQSVPSLKHGGLPSFLLENKDEVYSQHKNLTYTLAKSKAALDVWSENVERYTNDHQRALKRFSEKRAQQTADHNKKIGKLESVRWKNLPVRLLGWTGNLVILTDVAGGVYVISMLGRNPTASPIWTVSKNHVKGLVSISMDKMLASIEEAPAQPAEIQP